ncbi:MAG: cytochrome c oxidase accessory protein CcoG [Deltaproteobacteria bacterium]|jgi:cytochrome c oxidase accessory protein FixG|nr:cytochrome c oxidase accessory protein CcoG [Deltaproteobacteria bacterium]
MPVTDGSVRAGSDERAPAENTNDFQVVSLYERWRKIQYLWVKGRFQSLRRFALGVLVAVFYIGPWLRWEGRQAIWLNLPERKFMFWETTFWPQDFVLLALLLVIAAFTLFVFTVAAGRLWCGFACPQTVWTLCYVWIERKIEGGRYQRIKLDQAPWTAAKFAKKGLKYLCWAVLALSVSVTFVGYFTPIEVLLREIAELTVGPWEAFAIFGLAGASFLFSGVLREQVCLHMCPYARFQSVMFDRDTLIVSYDARRGEPRGGRSRRVDPDAQGLGSCVDCGLCVRACPTGIDIRDGLQYECITCAACIDVCNGVMDKMGYAPDLIRFSSENQDEGVPKANRRLRLWSYAAVLLTVSGILVFDLATRVPLGLDIIRDRGRLYRESWDGSVENTYTLLIRNMEQHPHTYEISAEGEIPLQYSGVKRVEIEGGSQVSIPISLMSAPGAGGAPNSSVEFTVEKVGEPVRSVTKESRFLRPLESISESGSSGDA